MKTVKNVFAIMAIVLTTAIMIATPFYMWENMSVATLVMGILCELVAADCLTMALILLCDKGALFHLMMGVKERARQNAYADVMRHQMPTSFNVHHTHHHYHHYDERPNVDNDEDEYEYNEDDEEYWDD